MLTCCPTPIGAGETFTNEYVGSLHGGVCAVVLGISNIEDVMEMAKIAANIMAVDLFFNLFIIFPLYFGGCYLR